MAKDFLLFTKQQYFHYVKYLQVDFRKLSRSGRPKYSSGGHAALNAVASGCGPYSTSAAAAHSSALAAGSSGQNNGAASSSSSSPSVSTSQ